MQCRIAPSIGALEGDPHQVWGTTEYKNDIDPTVFFGLYGIPDFYALWRHKGPKYILWAGSDITHFLNGYWLEDGGSIKISARPLALWISKNCESWVENQVEYDALKKVGIESKICPSFMGNIADYEISYTPSIKPKLYTSVSGNNFKLYGWDKIHALAEKHPQFEFHLYGNTRTWECDLPNVLVHGRVPKEQMNEEIKGMQGGLRLTEFDGFSEIVAKSVLWGQWPVSLIPYPHSIPISDIQSLVGAPANIEGRNYYRHILNKYPWKTK